MISTVIPTRNRPELLMQRAIASVQAQTYDDWECIVVGDDTDGVTIRAMRALCRRDRRFRFWNLPPGKRYEGVAAWNVSGVRAWNAGLRRTHGEWRSYLGDDDAYLPCHHEALLAAADEDADFVQGQSMVISASHTGRLFGLRGGPFDIPQGAYICRSTFDLRGDPVPSDEPWDSLMLKRVMATARVAYVPEIVHHYYAAPENACWHGLA